MQAIHILLGLVISTSAQLRGLGRLWQKPLLLTKYPGKHSKHFVWYLDMYEVWLGSQFDLGSTHSPSGLASSPDEHVTSMMHWLLASF